jgi:transposase-like protein
MSNLGDKKFQIQSKINRTFSVDFKRQKVSDIEKGLVRIADLCKQYEVSRASVYKWLYLYGKVEKGVKTVVQMESEQVKNQLLQQRLGELERIIGQKQLQIDYLEKGFELASAELGYDLKKKYAPPRSNGSEPTPKNTPTI